jgi:uroporphyrinogen-III synthase
VKLLVIRPEPGATATATRAKAAGFEPQLLPFFAVQACRWAAPDPAQHDALLISSANAIRHGGPELGLLRALPVHAIGERSAGAAGEAGFAIASSGQSGIEACIAKAHHLGHHRLLWLAGEDRNEPVLPAGTQLTIRTVYASALLALPADAAERIRQADVVALHSPRAARLFGETVDRLGLDRLSIRLAVFSPAIAAAAGSGWGGIAIAPALHDSAMLSAAAGLGRIQSDTTIQKGIP